MIHKTLHYLVSAYFSKSIFCKHIPCHGCSDELPSFPFNSDVLISPATETLPTDSSQLKLFSRNCLQPEEVASPKFTPLPLWQPLSVVNGGYKGPLVTSICDKFKEPSRFQKSLRDSLRSLSSLLRTQLLPLLLSSTPPDSLTGVINGEHSSNNLLHWHLCLRVCFLGNLKCASNSVLQAFEIQHPKYVLPSGPLLMWYLRPGMPMPPPSFCQSHPYVFLRTWMSHHVNKEHYTYKEALSWSPC